MESLGKAYVGITGSGLLFTYAAVQTRIILKLFRLTESGLSPIQLDVTDTQH